MKKYLIAASLLASVGVAKADVVAELKNWFAAYADKNHINETFVFAPGYKMLVGNKAVPVYGVQSCPSADGKRIWFFGGDPQGGSGCMVIEKSTDSVQARFLVGGEKIVEVWTVEHPARDRLLLRRPNGELIHHAE